MLKKLLIVFLLACTLVDLFRFTILDEALPEASIIIALCIASFYLFNHLIVRVYLDSHIDQDN